MFILKLYDRNGVELQMGDTVRVSNGRTFDFYCEVKYLEQEKVIAPFHTFSFMSFEKVDSVPEHAHKSPEDRYNIWYVYHDSAEKDAEGERLASEYLMGWRQCEHLLDKRCYRIEPLPVPTTEINAKEQLSLFDLQTDKQAV